MGNFAFLDFDDLIFKFLLSLFAMVKIAGVVLRQSMGVTKDETALAFDSKQSYLFIAVETSFAILLLTLCRLEGQLVHSNFDFLLCNAERSRTVAG